MSCCVLLGLEPTPVPVPGLGKGRRAGPPWLSGGGPPGWAASCPAHSLSESHRPGTCGPPQAACTGPWVSCLHPAGRPTVPRFLQASASPGSPSRSPHHSSWWLPLCSQGIRAHVPGAAAFSMIGCGSVFLCLTASLPCSCPRGFPPGWLHRWTSPAEPSLSLGAAQMPEMGVRARNSRCSLSQFGGWMSKIKVPAGLP